MATIYAVVRYTNNLKTSNYFGMNVYSTQSSNLEKMQTYKEEIANKYPTQTVVLVPRETAKKMHEVWYNYFENTGKELSRQDKKRSIGNRKRRR